MKLTPARPQRPTKILQVPKGPFIKDVTDFSWVFDIPLTLVGIRLHLDQILNPYAIPPTFIADVFYARPVSRKSDGHCLLHLFIFGLTNKIGKVSNS